MGGRAREREKSLLTVEMSELEFPEFPHAAMKIPPWSLK